MRAVSHNLSNIWYFSSFVNLHRGGSLYGLPLCLSSGQCRWAESFGTNDSGSELMEAMTAPSEGSYYLPSDKPGFGTALTEKLVQAHAID